MKEIIDALSQCVLFDGISKTKIKQILSKTNYHIKEFNKNEFICRTDQDSIGVGLIISGCVEAQKILPSGNIVCILHKKAGDAFGGSIMFSSFPSVYPCDVFSKEKCRILFLDKQSMFKLFENPLFAENLLNSFANRILYYERRLELFSYSSIQKKIAFYLLDEQKTTGNHMINLPFTKKTWAEYLNVSRPSLSRELKKLISENIIKADGNKIRIINENKLMYLLQQ